MCIKNQLRAPKESEEEGWLARLGWFLVAQEVVKEEEERFGLDGEGPRVRAGDSEAEDGEGGVAEGGGHVGHG